ncbi:hypothetical protein OUZ56_005465 [Daphnia magna]|uniref:Uncharacterized protein n=1 Tax=Daphnia magna TaxID=35525 RepID=A0ABQ9YSW5_9CRUS|nr:hypothetical protein OUZ56_005465 [Daphnia magna]
MGTPGSFKYASSSSITFIGPTDPGLGVSITDEYKDWLALLFLVIHGQHLCLNCYQQLQLLVLDASRNQYVNLQNKDRSADTSLQPTNTADLIEDQDTANTSSAKQTSVVETKKKKEKDTTNTNSAKHTSVLETKKKKGKTEKILKVTKMDLLLHKQFLDIHNIQPVRAAPTNSGTNKAVFHDGDSIATSIEPVHNIHMIEYAPSADQMENAETNIVAALMTLVTNTGLGRFADASTLIDNWNEAASLNSTTSLPQYISNLINDINHNVTEVDMGRIVEEFLHSWNIEARLFACASCGIKAFEMGNDQSHSISIKELDSLLISDADRDKLLNIPLKFRSMASYYQSTSTSLYNHLHREFVTINAATENQQEEECATLCLMLMMPQNEKTIKKLEGATKGLDP